MLAALLARCLTQQHGEPEVDQVRRGHPAALGGRHGLHGRGAHHQGVEGKGAGIADSSKSAESSGPVGVAEGKAR